MAWRLHNHVLRGEIDNRSKGVVTGRIWLSGVEVPLQLSLTGNACRDLAGCLITFHNTGEVLPIPKGQKLYPVQEGRIGDLTASRKVRVFDLPLDEALKMIKNGDKPPEHMANSLYLEWYSKGNGRVVLESVDFEITISAPEWKMSREEEADRNEQAGKAFNKFMGEMEDALNEAKEKVDYENEAWDEHDYEKFMRESDAHTDKFSELIDKYGDNEEIIAREMGWTEEDSDSGENGPSWEIDYPDEETPELIPAPATEGIDWIRTENGDIRHPLQNRCFEAAKALRHEIRDIDPEQTIEALTNLLFEYQTTAVKLAGILNHLAYGRDAMVPGFIIAGLKRALGHLHKTQQLLSETEKENLLLKQTTDRVLEELFEIREGILKLMDEFRGRQ
jgi:hypothetical protein